MHFMYPRSTQNAPAIHPFEQAAFGPSMSQRWVRQVAQWPLTENGHLPPVCHQTGLDIRADFWYQNGF